jgi:hypothetical protein
MCDVNKEYFGFLGKDQVYLRSNKLAPGAAVCADRHVYEQSDCLSGRYTVVAVLSISRPQHTFGSLGLSSHSKLSHM